MHWQTDSSRERRRAQPVNFTDYVIDILLIAVVFGIYAAVNRGAARRYSHSSSPPSDISNRSPHTVTTYHSSPSSRLRIRRRARRVVGMGVCWCAISTTSSAGRGDVPRFSVEHAARAWSTALVLMAVGVVLARVGTPQRRVHAHEGQAMERIVGGLERHVLA